MKVYKKISTAIEHSEFNQKIIYCDGVHFSLYEWQRIFIINPKTNQIISDITIKEIIELERSKV